jgi:hypothetical protein
MIVLPQTAEAAALTGRHSAGDEIGSTRGFRADRSAEGTESETDGSTGCRFGLKSASASWRALERRRALALRARSLTSNSASRSVAERARWSFVLKVLQQKTMLVSLRRCDERMLVTPLPDLADEGLNRPGYRRRSNDIVASGLSRRVQLLIRARRARLAAGRCFGRSDHHGRGKRHRAVGACVAQDTTHDRLSNGC